ncbi:auxin-responsive protein SAUR76-like [Juglans microcarpa x Juglans regia]|uniref:auxin-responsive protein SAUR76-like n=1 Tax=Juglans microcarpa x Juglans regia TaxID=2249226 RepID=UPI001B7DBED1|nr:auxin-responsive protein SAUR76-like [Juglans microcarpa x Juglans regia]
MDCLVLPVTILRQCYSGTRLGYRPLSQDGFADSGRLVTVVVGKEKREFLVDSFVLEENPFRVLIEMMKKDDQEESFDGESSKKGVIFVDVDAILFEHMLWLMRNDCSSLFQLNLKEIIDFYAQDS